jgi:hypothetical protein
MSRQEVIQHRFGISFFAAKSQHYLRGLLGTGIRHANT